MIRFIRFYGVLTMAHLRSCSLGAQLLEFAHRLFSSGQLQGLVVLLVCTRYTVQGGEAGVVLLVGQAELPRRR